MSVVGYQIGQMPYLEDRAVLVLFRHNFTQVKLSVSKFVLLFFFNDPTLDKHAGFRGCFQAKMAWKQQM